MTENTSDLIRKRLIAHRSQLSVAQRQRGSLLIRARLFTWLGLASDRARAQGIHQPLIVAAYWALEDEPDLAPVLEQWDEAGIIIALPVMVQNNAPLEFHQWTTETVLTPAKFGVMEPPRGTPLTPDIILVPTLGYTQFADRIGYGKGFYDRTLYQLRRSGIDPITIGIAWNEGSIEAEFADYQSSEHDQQLDVILTPSGWVPTEPNPFASPA